MNTITGEPQQIELGNNPQIGGPSETDDVGVELVTDTSNWFLETDVDGSNRPFKIRKTQIATDNGECLVFDDAGALQLPQIVGGASQVLGVDASGNVTAVAGGGGTNQVTGTGTENAIVLFDSDGNTLKDSATHLDYDQTNRNLFLGTEPVSISVGVAQDNYAVGVFALDAVTTGDKNVALGTDALGAVNIGDFNIGIGNNAGSSTNSGDFNVYMGDSAGSSNVTSSQNTLIGHAAGGALTSTSNTCVGSLAGNAITTGGDNTCLGQNANAAATLTNQTAIGHDATCDASNQMTLGDANVTQVRVTSDGACDFGDATHRLKDVYMSGSLFACGVVQCSLSHLTNMIAWYDTSMIGSVTRSTDQRTVTGWDSLVSNDYPLSNVSGTPYFEPDTPSLINGKPTVQFTLNAYMNSVTDDITWDDFTIVMVFEHNSGGNGEIFDSSRTRAIGANPPNGNHWLEVYNTGAGMKFHMTNDSGTTDTMTQASCIALGVPVIAVVRKSGTDVKMWTSRYASLNAGAAAASMTLGAGTWGTSSGNIRLGPETPNDYIGETIVYDDALSLTDINSIQWSLVYKWAITDGYTEFV